MNTIPQPNAYTLKLMQKAMKRENVSQPGKWLNSKLRKQGFDVDGDLRSGLSPDAILWKYAQKRKQSLNAFLRALIESEDKMPEIAVSVRLA